MTYEMEELRNWKLRIEMGVGIEKWELNFCDWRQRLLGFGNLMISYHIVSNFDF